MSTQQFTRRSVLAGAAGLTSSLFVRDSAGASKRHRFAVVGRGPMGAADLATYKYVVTGDGQIRQ